VTANGSRTESVQSTPIIHGDSGVTRNSRNMHRGASRQYTQPYR
jgi:hypothetical protein